MEDGCEVWLRDTERAWVRAKILSKDAHSFMLHLQITGGRKHNVQCPDFKETDDIKLCNVVRDTSIVASEKENSSSKKTHEVDDLISLTHLHEPAILHALEMRFAHDIIYTSTGPILIAVNPFKAVSLYTEEVRQQSESANCEFIFTHL
jgi:myosin-5